MKTILIPFDSSPTSENVITYVRDLLREQLSVEKIFILQSLHVSILGKEAQEARDRADEALKSVVARLQSAAGPGTVIKYAISDFPLLRALHQAISQLEPDLIIAGSDSEEEESLVGDEIITISKSSPVPVLVIPSGCRHETVKNALVPCNFANISNLSLLEGLKQLEPVNLMLLNVDPNSSFAEQRKEIESNISELLKEYKHTFYYSENEDIVDGILEFSADKDVHMIIALPGKHSFFYRLTHTSITQALTQNSGKPVLLLKENDE